MQAALFLSILFLAIVSAAASNSTVRFLKDSAFKMGTPKLHGTGCPPGSVQSVVSSDQQSVSFLFSEYVAETSWEQLTNRKACNLAVPVDLKQGVSMGIFRVDYRGFADVPSDDRSNKALFNAEYFWAGKRGPRTTKRYGPGFTDEIFISDKIAAGAIVWSPCGASTIFRIATSIFAKRGKESSDVSIALDSVDATVDKAQLFKYYLTFRKC